MTCSHLPFLLQVTGVLRNLAVSPAHTATFTEAGVIPALRLTAAALIGQQEVVLNVGRILSKLSLSEECQVRWWGKGVRG